MGDVFLFAIGLSCIAAIVMGIRALRHLKNGRDDDDAFGPRR